MCGIVGIYSRFGGKASSKKNSIFETLLTIDQLRGKDSTGVFGFDFRDASPITYKTLGTPYEVLSGAPAMFNSRDCKVGHNRHATAGSVTAANAHPFTHGHITLVHNGTLRNTQHLRTKYNIPDKITVDSEMVAYAMSKVEDEREVFQDIDGAFAFVWYNSKHKLLNFVRNTERPLSFARVEDDSKFFIFGSEGLMLQFAMLREGISNYKIFNFPEYIHYSLDQDFNLVSEGAVDRYKGPTFQQEIPDYTWQEENSYDEYYGSYGWGKKEKSEQEKSQTALSVVDQNGKTRPPFIPSKSESIKNIILRVTEIHELSGQQIRVIGFDPYGTEYTGVVNRLVYGEPDALSNLYAKAQYNPSIKKEKVDDVEYFFAMNLRSIKDIDSGTASKLRSVFEAKQEGQRLLEEREMQKKEAEARAAAALSRYTKKVDSKKFVECTLCSEHVPVDSLVYNHELKETICGFCNQQLGSGLGRAFLGVGGGHC